MESMIKAPAFASLILLSACGSAPDTGAAPDPIARVRTVVANAGTSSEVLTVYGVAEAGPGGIQNLVTPSEAIITRIAAPTGTKVQSGQIIAYLQASSASRLDLARAASDASAANAALARFSRLRIDGLASDADVETARAAATSASALRASLSKRAAGLILRAPIAGTVQNLNAKAGDQLAAGTMVASIAGLGNARARFGVDAVALQTIRIGQRIRIQAVGSPKAQETVVAGIDAQPDATTRLGSVFATVPPGSGIAVGQPLQAGISVGAVTTGITLPYGALLDDGGKPYVFVVDKDIAHRVDIVPGNTTGDQVTVLHGLAAGNRVVIEGGTALEDGMKVRERGKR
ncbi:efflux RND transporter periplasmic adaptor subunit [Sphingobium cupriresistens]|jgi:RND family efflux transporter MFP subunit|nr:efflux RND transporter periplasmic adaptor subunit [Sphingobium cupriresistens]